MGATVVEWSAACVRYQVSASGRQTADSKPGHEYELFLISRRELALIVDKQRASYSVRNSDTDTLSKDPLS
ncbi:hypothetical protein FHG87_011729 [Trinorchestia longiramus]|nr:hypothetical protein FHG87_011729 [Trinorchestia longiramus]